MHDRKTAARLLGGVLACLSFFVLGGWGIVAYGQTTPPQSIVEVSVVSLTPSINPSTPLHVEVSVRNKGQLPISNGRVQLRMFPRVGSRFELRQALDGNSQRESPYGTANDITPALEPGAQTSIVFDWDLSHSSNRFRAGAGGEGVYPLEIRVQELDRDLWTGWAATVFNASKPLAKLNVTWVLPIHNPSMLDSNAIEGGIAGRKLALAYRGSRVTRAVGPHGSLLTLSQSFEKLAALSVTFAPTPMVLDELGDIEKGFRQQDPAKRIDVGKTDATPRGARVVLERMRAAVGLRSAELASVPYSRADLPTLLHDASMEDLTAQLKIGRTAAATQLNHGPNGKILVPGNLRLDDGSISAVVSLGVRTVVLDEATLPPQPGLYGAQKPVVVQGAAGSQVTAILGDSAIRDRLETERTPDPVLRAQAVFAEIASTWLELPNDGARGLVIASSTTPDVETVSVLSRALAAAPWIHMRSVSGFVDALPINSQPQRISQVEVPASESFTSVLSAERSVDILGRVISAPASATEPLHRMVLASESADWISGAQRNSLSGPVRAKAQEILSAIQLPSGRQVTLTSRTGELPVTVINGTSYKIHILVRLTSAKVSFPHGDQQPIDVTDTPTTIHLSAQARTAGAFPVSVQLLTPDGEIRIGGNDIIVRSTAVSFVALLAMIGGAFVMLVAWIKRGGHRKGGRRDRSAGAPAPA